MLPRFVAMFSLGMWVATLLICLVRPTAQAVVVPVPVVAAPLEPEAAPLKLDPAPAPWTRLCGVNASESLDAVVEDIASEAGVDAALLAAVMTKESTCNPDAVGGAGEIGLNQIHPRVWVPTLQGEELIKSQGDLFDPATNLRCSAYILTGLLNRTDGDVWKALRRYNGSGPKARKYADAVHGLYTTLLIP